jgi:Protein of unknown function (DUF1302)
MRFAIVIALGIAVATPAFADDPKVAVFDLRPVTSGGQTDLAVLREAVRMSAQLRERLEAAGGVKVIGPDELKAILGPLYRVTTFDCREEPACLQPMMKKLAKKGIKRAIVGTYEKSGNRAQLTLQGVETKTGAFTKVEVFEAARDGGIDEDKATKVMASVAALKKAEGPKPEEPKPEEPKPEEPKPEEPTGDTTDVLTTDVPPPPPPPVPDRIQVLGWGRTHTAFGQNPPTPDPLAPPYDDVESRNALYLAARYQRSKTFEATASGVLEWDMFDQSSTRRTSYEAALRELYVGIFRDGFDVRIGNQRIAWGKGDAVSPNDVLNPPDLRDPIFTDTELRRIPTFAVRADIEGGSNALQLVVQPFFVPARYEVYGSNWASIQPASPIPIRGLFRLATGLFDSSLHEPFQSLFAQTNLPDKPSAGVRYTYTGHKFDTSLYYHYGYNATPQVTLDPMFGQAIAMVDWTMANASTLKPVLDLLDAGVSPYTATFRRRHHVGIDGVTTVGPFAIKVDAAYENASVFYQPDLESFVSPSAEGVLSVEYQSGEIGKTVLVEGIYQKILNTPPMTGLIGYKQDSVGVAVLARWTVGEVIEGEVRAVLAAVPRTEIVQPQLAYKPRSGGLTVAVGGLYIHGEALSLGDYYGRNSCAYALIKYAF